MRVLVTGASGFTARHVIPILRQRGYEVSGLTTSDCDIRDAVALREAVAEARPESVLHLAGTPNLPDSEADTAFTVNVHGTINLLAACEKLSERPRKIILVSSAYVYGDTGSAPAREDAPLDPRGAYGKSKREMEIAAARWFDRLPLIVARPFNYTGVGHGESFLVPKLVRAFRDRSPDVSFVDPTVVRDYSDARWVAEVYVSLLQCPIASQAINVCSGIGTPLTALVDIFEKLTGHRPASYPKPRSGARPAALVGDPSRLIRLIGGASPFSLRDTLRWMLETAYGKESIARAEA